MVEQTSSLIEVHLQCAIKKDDVSIVEEILGYGISPNLMFEDGKRPLHLSIIFDSQAVGCLLVHHPLIDLDACDKNGTSPLFLANAISSKFFLSLLVWNGALVCEKGPEEQINVLQENVCQQKKNKRHTHKDSIVISKVKYAIPHVENDIIEEMILKETSHLLEMPNLNIHDIDDARGIRRRKTNTTKTVF